ncbi:MAG: hypothetical protein U9R51_06375 [Actinomycetota bacterium]|nr:hypothetical protein [Actinomycetota bacterium]
MTVVDPVHSFVPRIPSIAGTRRAGTVNVLAASGASVVDGGGGSVVVEAAVVVGDASVGGVVIAGSVVVVVDPVVVHAQITREPSTPKTTAKARSEYLDR